MRCLSVQGLSQVDLKSRVVFTLLKCVTLSSLRPTHSIAWYHCVRVIDVAALPALQRLLGLEGGRKTEVVLVRRCQCPTVVQLELTQMHAPGHVLQEH